MTSQPLVASFYVDYLSHPLSSEHLLVCYQQITRQIAHAPLSAKDAATSFQHQSQTMIEVLGQHQTLAVPQTKERPAPVGCQSQLKRMQNALWRRSSQSTLAKDVALVRPESLNWQKECDVLWLYGPLYNAAQPQQQEQSLTCDWTAAFSQYSSQQRTPSPLSVDGLSSDIESLAIAAAAEVSVSPLEELPAVSETATATMATAAAEENEAPESTTTATAIETQLSPPSPSTSSEAVASDPIVVVDTAASASASTSTSINTTTTTAIDVPSPASNVHSEADASVSPLHIDTSAPAAAVKDESSSSSLSSSPIEENALSRPQKSALKQMGTMAQTVEELRSFTQTPHYLALAKALASFSLTSSTEGSSSSTLVAFVEGTRSEPMSPMADGDESSTSTFFLPIFPSPTKYHFRSHDQRRASFPKSASHPSRLNFNINLNMNVSVRSAPVAGGRRATIGGNGSTSGHHHRGGRLVPSASAKQLRFSLEVQELIFLPTSPPFRISRAQPTRAHSDPAIQTTTCSSFIAPQSSQVNGQQDGLSPTLQHSLHRAGLISTATASAATFENATTTFIKVRTSSSHGSRSSSRVYYQDDDENRPECNYNDDYYLEDCREGGISTTDEEFTDDGDDEDDSEDLLDEEDEEYDEFNGLGRSKRHSTGFRNKRRRHTTSRRYRLSSNDGIVARRANDTAHPAKAAAGPGMLWQVYTAVTGVKELIAWYGSMVYHSSSL
ncbi:hypothetical protein BGZ47_010145 [Haplosporangium gracile]|nr:hypothetical protein BGZ47_010145 [Haplosporangium gracile]